MKEISKRDKIRLALETELSHRTIEKWVNGQRVNDSTAAALNRAVKNLGIKTIENGPVKNVEA